MAKRKRLADAKKNALTTYWKEHPDAKASDVARVMKVSMGTANIYKKKAGLTKSRGKRATPRATSARTAPRGNSDELMVFALRNGGIDGAISALEGLRKKIGG